MAFRKIIKDSEGGQKYVTEQEEELVFDQVPTKGSFNPVTSDGVAKALSVGEGGESIGDVVPPDTSAENQLVNELFVMMRDRVVAEAMNQVNARLEAFENKFFNSGDVVADTVNAQEIMLGGVKLSDLFEPKSTPNTLSMSSPLGMRSEQIDTTDVMDKVEAEQLTKEDMR